MVSPNSLAPGTGAPDSGAPSAARSATSSADTHPSRWRMLVLLACAELLGMSLWFAASAVSAQYRTLWDLSASQSGWLTTIVQLGFVVGTAVLATLNVVDIVPAGRLFAAGAVVGSASNAALLLAPGFRTALACRMLTGIALAAVYPPAMKMISTWFRARNPGARSSAA